MREVVRLDVEGSAEDAQDEVAIEEPLEIRIAGETVATTMRTPGHDRQLAVGFLFAEGVLRSVDELGALYHCGRPGEEGYGNVIEVLAAPGHRLDDERVVAARRGTLTTTACGVCGRRSIEDLLARCGVQPGGAVFEAHALRRAFAAMREAQSLFSRTGGVHAAGVFDARGEPLALYEDIGRHNAVDKAVGSLVLAGKVPARECMLAVSGRASFEMVQKAVVAGVPLVASVSAASSLAVDLARRTNTTLVGFVRGERMNVYAGAERLRACPV